MVASTLHVYYLEAIVLFNPGASYSFVSPIFTSRMNWQPLKLMVPLSMATPLSDELETNIVFLSYPVLVEGQELRADLVLLDVIDFNIILGIDWLAQHYTTLDCREKEVIFRIPNDVEFRFRGDRSSMPKNIISTIITRKMLEGDVKAI